MSARIVIFICIIVSLSIPLSSAQKWNLVITS
jgi:hypothetical protein